MRSYCVSLPGHIQDLTNTPMIGAGGKGKLNLNSPNRYVGTGDGRRFLVNSSLEEVSQTPITVILNWNAQLKKN